MSKPGARNKGFTMVELLVVVAIISILVAILMPVIRGVSERARETKCTGQLVQIAAALSQYKADYGRYPPRPYYDTARQTYMGGVSALYPDYIPTKDILICPNDTRIPRASAPHNYSTYNGLIHGAMNPTLSPSSPDFWRFEAQAGGVGSGTVLCCITYNYGGFTNEGWDESWWDTSTGRWTMLSPQGGTAPAWLTAEGKKWRHYPRMANPRAPDNTIALRCRAHHAHFAPDETESSPQPTKWKDIYVRIGGDAKTVAYTPMAAPNADGASKWKIQD